MPLDLSDPRAIRKSLETWAKDRDMKHTIRTTSVTPDEAVYVIRVKLEEKKS